MVPNVCLVRRSRFIYRSRLHRGRQGERRSFAGTDYATLLDAAHQQLGGPIVLIWDNLNTHISTAMLTLIAARDWLHVIRLPAYAPDLNPVEHVWSHLKRSLGNLAVHGIDHLAAIVKHRLKRIQYRPELTDAFFAPTGLTPRPWTALMPAFRDLYLRDPSYAEPNAKARGAALGGRLIPTTGVVVQTLRPDWLVEIEIIAAA